MLLVKILFDIPINRVGETGLIPGSTSHTTTHAVPHVAVPYLR